MQFLTDFFYNLLVLISYITPGHFVWVGIVAITLLIRFAFLKPSIKLVEVQHKQKKLAPKLAELKGKHKDDNEALQKATLELYKQEGVNPLSGCLPMIIQMIVLIAFYQIFRQNGVSEIRVDHLYSFTPRPEYINASFFGIDLSQTVAAIFKEGGVKGYLVLLFPLLAAGTQLIQSLQTRAMQPKQSGGQEEGFQRALNAQFTYFFPLMTGYLSYTLSAALSIYWVTQTAFMTIQQAMVTKRFNELREEVENAEVAALARGETVTTSKSTKKGVVVEVREKK